MKNISVKLLHCTPKEVLFKALQKPYGKEADLETAKRVFDAGHGSVFEHVYLTFDIKGISRGCLQQLVRHRIASYTVQSTRYQLKKLIKDENAFVDMGKGTKKLLEEHRKDIVKLSKNMSNDDLKYVLPEALRTELIMTMNMRSLHNFFITRMTSRAHQEIMMLALKIKDQLPSWIDSIIFVYEEEEQHENN